MRTLHKLSGGFERSGDVWLRILEQWPEGYLRNTDMGEATNRDDRLFQWEIVTVTQRTDDDVRVSYLPRLRPWLRVEGCIPIYVPSLFQVLRLYSSARFMVADSAIAIRQKGQPFSRAGVGDFILVEHDA